MKILSRCLFLIALFSLCGDASERPNFVIFIADDVSWDDFACTGNPDVRTPTIDALAAEGRLFRQVYLTASSCSPSRNSILTGRYPHNTGAAELHTEPPPGTVSFPEVLREAGYYTAHSGKWHSGQYIVRGFDRMITDPATITNSGSGGWLTVVRERPRTQPFLFWFASLDAHRDWGENIHTGTHDPASLTIPIGLADAPATRQDLARYYDEIHRFDRAIAEVLDELKSQGALENTFVVILADNGRPFPHSKTRVNDRGMRTPFVVSWPRGIARPGECSALVSVIDLPPTLMDLAGVPVPTSFQGHSFRDLLADPSRAFRQHVFAEHNWHDYEAFERMARKGPFFYIRNYRPNFANLGPADAISSPSHADLVTIRERGELSPLQADLFQSPRPHEELYDCITDPLQLHNLASDPRYRKVLEELRRALDAWMQDTLDTVPEEITGDWYRREAGYQATPGKGQRGTMPGVPGEALTTTAKGPF